MIPNIPPKLFSFSAVVVGYILIDDMTANEQNALGNWLMLVAQVLSTNAFYKAVMQERGTEISGSKVSSDNKNYNERDETVIMLRKMIDALQREVDNLKKDNY